MAAPVHTLTNQPALEIPEPPAGFGQDGGKFYRCYDALAEELDEDMTKGLKEQLDGLLIFAGLFAGVNSAFLGLTLPLLSPDPTEDTNALLLQNNNILLQLALGRNDSLPSNYTLPSTSFVPTPDVYAVNVLFALSMIIAIIASFIAVLGRQWLVYYRKRSGGGADHQRLEQLKRFLGAQRWHLEFVLDDALPSLLQIALVIFCVSLVIYLRILNPSISGIIATTLSITLVSFLGTTLFTLWDRFCPFHSPRSHFISWLVKNARGLIRKPEATPGGWSLTGRDPIERPSLEFKSWLAVLKIILLYAIYSIKHGRRNWFLQAHLVRRAVCTSEDSVTLLHAIANIPSLNVEDIEFLWSEENFRDRFLELCKKANFIELPARRDGPDNPAVATLRLYTCAFAHITLSLKAAGMDTRRLCLMSLAEMRDNPALRIPNHKFSNSSSSFIRASLAWFIISSSFYGINSDSFSHPLTVYSSAIHNSDWDLLCLISYCISTIAQPNVFIQPPKTLVQVYTG
ncbi:hypothetical protein FRC01_001027 [Tulasnella sp. 417]|nr:hypothetical protein FRC01_001027 [Tulasnella sp. 417]